MPKKEEAKTMKAVIYARYSSDAQRDESIEGQIRDCMEYAKYNGMTVVSTYVDRALSAKTDNRPGFQKMIKDSTKHVFDLILVWKLDRFARNRYDSAYYKNILKKNGVKVISAKESISEGAEGIILESVLEGYAEYYSVELAEKVNRGMKDNALKCMNNGSIAPMGYYVDEEQHLQIDGKKAPFVREIFLRFADGESIKSIIDDMRKRGIGITIRGKRGRTKPHENPLSHNIIHRMMTNRKYIGEYHFKDIVIKNGVPAIIDQELFDRVQKRIEANKRAPARHKAEAEYFLTTRLFCGKCGAMMIGESGTSKSGKTYHYYKCAMAKKLHQCDKKPVRKEEIEDVVIKAIIKKIMDDRLVEQLSYGLYDLQMQENQIVPALKQKLADVEERIGNVLAAIESGVVLNTTKSRLEKLEKEQERLSAELAEAEIKNPLLTREQILFALTKYRDLDWNTDQGKQALIDSFVNKIFLYDDRILITCNYKDGTEEIALKDVNLSEPATDENDEEKEKSKSELRCSDLLNVGDPYGNRTHIFAVRGRRLDRLTKGPSFSRL